MKRRDFLKLIGVTPFLPSVFTARDPVTCKTKSTLSRDEMFGQLYRFEDRDNVTIYMSSELYNKVLETMYRTAGTTDIYAALGYRVAVSRFLPYVNQKGEIAHAIGVPSAIHRFYVWRQEYLNEA